MSRCISYGKWVIFQCCHVSFSGVVIWLFFLLPLILFDLSRMVKPQWLVLQKKGWWFTKCQTSPPIPPPQKNKKIPTKVGTSSSWGISGCSAQSAPLAVKGGSFWGLSRPTGGWEAKLKQCSSFRIGKIRIIPTQYHRIDWKEFFYHGSVGWLLVNPYFHTSWAVGLAGPNLLFENSLDRLLRNVKLLGKNVSGTFLGWKKHPVWKLGETGEIVVMDESVRSWQKSQSPCKFFARPLIQWLAKSLNRGIYFINNSRVDNFILMVYPGLVGSWIFRVFGHSLVYPPMCRIAPNQEAFWTEKAQKAHMKNSAGGNQYIQFVNDVFVFRKGNLLNVTTVTVFRQGAKSRGKNQASRIGAVW